MGRIRGAGLSSSKLRRGSRNAVALLMLALVLAAAGAAAPPAEFQTEVIVGDGLNGPSGFEIAPDGRIFRSVNGARIQPSTYWHVWRKVRALSLTPEQLVTPLMKRPYDLRHSGVTWRLNCGIPAP